MFNEISCPLIDNFTLKCDEENYIEQGATCIPKEVEDKSPAAAVVVISCIVALLAFAIGMAFYLFRYSPRVRKIHANRKLLLYKDLAFSTSLSKKRRNAPAIKPLRRHPWQKQRGIDLVALRGASDEDQNHNYTMRACIQDTITSRKYTGLHGAAIYLYTIGHNSFFKNKKCVFLLVGSDPHRLRDERAANQHTSYAAENVRTV